jgi:hypothetical protein
VKVSHLIDTESVIKMMMMMMMILGLLDIRNPSYSDTKSCSGRPESLQLELYFPNGVKQDTTASHTG